MDIYVTTKKGYLSVVFDFPEEYKYYGLDSWGEFIQRESIDNSPNSWILGEYIKL